MIGPTSELPDCIYMPPRDALDELSRRRQDAALVERVNDALDGDIPAYLLRQDCFVLSRHIATPNNEALYVLAEAERYGATAVFSQDLKDKFTSVNSLKRRLARPELHDAAAANQNTYRKITLVDVAAAEGARLEDVVTVDGRPLHSVHASLFSRLSGRKLQVADDGGWIDRNGRGRLRDYYAAYLLLFLAHGVLFEEFETPCDKALRNGIIIPLIRDCEARFGVRPIIVRPHAPGQSPPARYYLAHDQSVFAASDFVPQTTRQPVASARAPLGRGLAMVEPMRAEGASAAV